MRLSVCVCLMAKCSFIKNTSHIYIYTFILFMQTAVKIYVSNCKMMLLYAHCTYMQMYSTILWCALQLYRSIVFQQVCNERDRGMLCKNVYCMNALTYTNTNTFQYKEAIKSLRNYVSLLQK